MKLHKKTCCSLLCLLCAASAALVSCGGASGTAVETAEKQDGTPVTEAVTETDERAPYADMAPAEEDLGGYTFRMGVTEGKEIVAEQIGYWTEAENGETVNDAIFRRNFAVEEAYNVKITLTSLKDTSTTVRKNIQAGDDFCDIMFSSHVADFIGHAQIGGLTDLNDLPEMNMTNPWWDARIDSLSLFGDRYMATGAITMEDDMREMCVMYNKTLYNQYDLPDPYEMVTSGTWTLDRMNELVSGVTRDLDGDGAMTVSDQWGLCAEVYAGWYFFLASGADTIVYENGAYRSAISDQSFYDKFDAAINLLIGKDVFITDSGKYDRQITTPSVWDEASKMFEENRVLLRTGTFSGTMYLRNMETDFGVLPIPKYSEEQDGYYCMVSFTCAPLAMPTTVQNRHAAALITEAMAYESMFVLTPAFYEVFLGEKILRDAQSREMVDILLDSKVYSLDCFASITGMVDKMNAMVQTQKNNIASAIASVEKSAQKKLDKFVEKFADIG
ncbi:MAG: extracellular solute-binding protein [Clostridia bacterium]|nr:extracellular solute-binding protein [Clostridia bacterium]